MAKEFHYGGQAVIEGVMMRGQRNMAVAVRSPNGEVHISTKPISNSQTGIRRIWFVRGVVVLIESLVLGIGALFESANISLGEEEQQKISGPLLWGTLAVSFAFAAAHLLRGSTPDHRPPDRPATSTIPRCSATFLKASSASPSSSSIWPE